MGDIEFRRHSSGGEMRLEGLEILEILDSLDKSIITKFIQTKSNLSIEDYFVSA